MLPIPQSVAEMDWNPRWSGSKLSLRPSLHSFSVNTQASLLADKQDRPTWVMWGSPEPGVGAHREGPLWAQRPLAPSPRVLSRMCSSRGRELREALCPVRTSCGTV